MLKKLLLWLLEHIDEEFYYKICELQIGGACGICGHYIPDEIFPIAWPYGVCKNHKYE